MDANNLQMRRNLPLWIGAVLIVLAVLSFVFFAVDMPGKQSLPWVNLLLSAAAVVLFAAGLRRASSQRERYKGKIAGWVFTVFSSLVLLFGILFFHESRNLPDANAAPQVGQKAPDFELKDTNEQAVSLAGLLAGPLDQAGKPPKAVLLVFYRGYW
jgi:hypothetical protein